MTMQVTAQGLVVEMAMALSESELRCEQFDMPVERLINLWLAKYGNDWVDVALVLNDNYYKYVYKRLKALNELEQHYLTDRSKFVCRKPD
jgi:hypothetical protein